MRDFEFDLFLNFGGHLDSHGNARRNDTLKQAAESRVQSRPKKSVRITPPLLPIAIRAVNSLQIDTDD
jgi:hypothetical protein